MSRQRVWISVCPWMLGEHRTRLSWPMAMQQLEELVAVIGKCGWVPSVLNPEHPVSSVSEGIDVVRRARSERFINFIERDGRN